MVRAHTSSGRLAAALPPSSASVPRLEQTAVTLGTLVIGGVYATAILRNYEATDSWTSTAMVVLAVAMGLAMVALGALGLRSRPDAGQASEVAGNGETAAGFGERLLRPIRAFDRGGARVEQMVIALALLAMVGLYFVNVLLRNLGNAPAWLESVFGSTQSPPWIEPIVRHLVVITGLVGASLATHERRHIRIEFLCKFMPRRGRRLADALTSLAASAVAILLLMACGSFLAIEQGTHIAGLGPLHVAHPIRVTAAFSVVPLALAVMAFRFFLHAMEALLPGAIYEDEEDTLAAEVRSAGPALDPAEDSAAAKASP